MSRDYTNLLQGYIADTIVGVNAMNIANENHQSHTVFNNNEIIIGILIVTLIQTEYDFNHIPCFAMLSNHKTCMGKMVETKGEWVCPECGQKKEAVQIHGYWFEK